MLVPPRKADAQLSEHIAFRIDINRPAASRRIDFILRTEAGKDLGAGRSFSAELIRLADSSAGS